MKRNILVLLAMNKITVSSQYSGIATIHDILGKKVMSMQLQSGENHINVDFAPGVYLVRLGNTSERITIR